MKSKILKFENFKIGGNNPVLIQTMIKEPLPEVKKILNTISKLKKQGCDFVRVAFKESRDSKYLQEIINKSKLPIEVDIHFHPFFAIQALNLGAKMIRINPGNIDKSQLKDIAQLASEKKAIIRVGANIGSVPEKYIKKNKVEGMVKIIQEYVVHLEKLGFYNIMLSAKSDSVKETYKVNFKLAKLFDYPIHVGVTATGAGMDSMVKSSIGIGSLLLQGIGDVIRVSYTGSVFQEVRIAKAILQALDLRRFGPDVISCPGCSRARIDLRKIATAVKSEVEKLNINKGIKIAVMGCEVNGPGEAKAADIGIAGGRGVGLIFKKGKIIKKVKEEDMVAELMAEIKTITGG